MFLKALLSVVVCCFVVSCKSSCDTQDLPDINAETFSYNKVLEQKARLQEKAKELARNRHQKEIADSTEQI